METSDRLSMRSVRPAATSNGAGPALKVSSLIKRFGGITAVDGVSFEVQAGAFMSLLGPSGSGKTTVLRMIAGFDTPDSGHITIDGREIERLPAYRRDIGVVFQRYALFPHMSVAENVGFALKQRRVGLADRQKKVDEALEMVGLAGYGVRRPSQLSGGEQQRVALARALVFQPCILLMDEPLAALDKRLRERMQQEIRTLQRRLGITTLYVTHDQTEAFVMSDVVAVMNGGRLEQIGPPRELYEVPQSAFVAQFLGDSNIFRGSFIQPPEGAGEMRLSDGSVIRCPPQDDAPKSITLLVRPEKLQITVSEPDPRTTNVLRGRVLETIFLGGVVQYLLSAGGQKLIVCVPNRADLAQLQAGAETLVAWAIGDTVVLR